MLNEPHAAELIATVRTIAAENPEGCCITRHYWDDLHECPSCVVGQALSRMGATRAELRVLEGSLIAMFMPNANSQQASWLRAIQVKVDGGDTYSAAVEYADRVYEDRSGPVGVI